MKAVFLRLILARHLFINGGLFTCLGLQTLPLLTNTGAVFSPTSVKLVMLSFCRDSIRGVLIYLFTFEIFFRPF